MKNSKLVETMGARRNCGRFLRVMLREVQPEHVPDMIEMLWRFGHSDKRILVPETGQWQMKMPHGYLLVGEGPVGRKIEPPLRQEALRLGPPYNGAQTQKSQPTLCGPRLDEHDTQGILALCEQARQTPRPKRDQVIIQIFSLNLDRCRPKALDAVELLIYDLIVNETE